MKRTILFGGFFSFAILGFSQSYTLEYSAKIIDQKDYQRIPLAHRKQLKKNRNRTSVFELKYIDGKSLYKPKYSIIGCDTTFNKKWFIGKLDLYKDFSNSTYFRMGAILKDQAIKEKFDVFKWTIEPRMDTVIYGFHCTKATADIYGEVVFAWFTREIPIMDGPSYYAGLPGLVLFAQTKSEVISISNIQLANKTSSSILIPSKETYISHQEYLTIPRAEIFSRMNEELRRIQEDEE